ncbi:MAG: protein kinase [Deltaproteobacteria bacterium]|nr:protein kinase [Deltaproteobacteria bacterium]
MRKKCEKCGADQEVAEGPDDLKGNRFCIKCGTPLVDFIGATGFEPPEQDIDNSDRAAPLPPESLTFDESTVRAIVSRDAPARQAGDNRTSEPDQQAVDDTGQGNGRDPDPLVSGENPEDQNVFEAPTKVYDRNHDHDEVKTNGTNPELPVLGTDEMDDKTEPMTVTAMQVDTEQPGPGEPAAKETMAEDTEVFSPESSDILKQEEPILNNDASPPDRVNAPLEIKEENNGPDAQNRIPAHRQGPKLTPSGLKLLSPQPSPPVGIAPDDDDRTGFTLDEDDLVRAGLEKGVDVDQVQPIPSLWQPDHEKPTVIIGEESKAGPVSNQSPAPGQPARKSKESLPSGSDSPADGKGKTEHETQEKAGETRHQTIDGRATMVPGRVFVDSTGKAKYAPYATVSTKMGEITSDGKHGPRGPELARGRHCRVLLVRDEGLSRDLALKEPLDPLADEKLRLQIKVLSSLSHPGIVHVVGAGETPEGRPYLLLPLLQQKTMASVLGKAGDLSSRLRVLTPFACLCRAIAHAHQRGVVHRSIHPGKVVLADSTNPVLLGFGRAVLDSEKDLTKKELAAEASRMVDSGDDFGDIDSSYMCPEQASREIDRMGPWSDVWSLGAILFHILTGRAPFHDANPKEAFLELLREPVPDPGELCREAPAELVEIAKKALSRDPAKRYQSAVQLASDLDAFQSGGWVRAYEHSRRGRRERLKWFLTVFRKELIITAAIVVVLLSVGISRHVQVLSQRNEARRARTMAEAQMKAALKAEITMKQQKQKALDMQRRAMRALAKDLLVKSREAEARGDRFLARIYTSAALANADLPQARTRLKAESTGIRPKLLWHEHPGVKCGPVAMSRNGKVACGSGNRIIVWDMSTGRETARMQTGSGVTVLAFSPDGSSLAVADTRGRVELWDPYVGQRITSFDGHDSSVKTLAFSPDGKLLASGGNDRLVRIWSVSDGALFQDLQGHEGSVQSLAFSPDGKFLASGGRDRTVRIWDLSQKMPVKEVKGQSGRITSLAFLGNGTLLSAGTRGSIRTWKPGSGFQSEAMTRPCKSIGKMSLSTRERGLVAVLCRNGTLKFLDAHDGSQRYAGLSLQGGADDLAFSADGTRLAVTGKRIGLEIFKPGLKTEPIAKLSGNISPVIGGAFSQDGSRVFFVFRNGETRARDLQSGVTEEILLQELQDGAGNVAFSRKKDIMAALLPRGRGARVFRLPSGEPLYSVDGRFTAVAVSPDARFLALCGRDRKVKVFDMSRDKEKASWKWSRGRLNALAFSNRSKLLSAGSNRGNVILFNFRSRHSKPKSREIDGIEPKSIAFAPGDRYLAFGLQNGGIMFWDLRRDREVGPLEGLDGPVTSIGFSQDGKLMAAGNARGEVMLWRTRRATRVDRLKPLGSLSPHQGAISSLVFSKDGRLATCGMDGSIRIWAFVMAEHLPELPPVDASGLELLNADEKDMGLKLAGSRIEVSPLLVETKLEPIK